MEQPNQDLNPDLWVQSLSSFAVPQPSSRANSNPASLLTRWTRAEEQGGRRPRSRVTGICGGFEHVHLPKHGDSKLLILPLWDPKQGHPYCNCLQVRSAAPPDLLRWEAVGVISPPPESHGRAHVGLWTQPDSASCSPLTAPSSAFLGSRPHRFSGLKLWMLLWSWVA